MELLNKKVNGENLQQILSKLKGYLDDEITGADVDKWYDGILPVGEGGGTVIWAQGKDIVNTSYVNTTPETKEVIFNE